MRESDLIGKGKGGRPKLPARNLLANGPAEPCGLCGVRADVGCKHRTAAGNVPPAMDPRKKKWRPRA